MQDLLTPLRYISDEISQNYNNKDWWRNRIHARINGPIQRRIHGPGIDIPDADWDTLVVLDACRADLFEEVSNTADWTDYRRVYSGAGATNRWLERQWDGDHGDTVYVSGSPMVSRHVPGAFHRLVEAWRDAIDEDLNGPDGGFLTDKALAVHEEYSDKRIVVHYMQPHYPFVRDPELQFTTFRNTDEWDVDGDSRAGDVWEALRAGIVDKSAVWTGYQRNLEYILEEVSRLLDVIDGRAVITSDHGNLLGEWSYPIPMREFGHPSELVQLSLTTVPWAVRDGPRRDIVKEKSQSESEATEHEIGSHLEALGYK